MAIYMEYRGMHFTAQAETYAARLAAGLPLRAERLETLALLDALRRKGFPDGKEDIISTIRTLITAG